MYVNNTAKGNSTITSEIYCKSDDDDKDGAHGKLLTIMLSNKIYIFRIRPVHVPLTATVQPKLSPIYRYCPCL